MMKTNKLEKTNKQTTKQNEKDVQSIYLSEGRKNSLQSAVLLQLFEVKATEQAIYFDKQERLID